MVTRFEKLRSGEEVEAGGKKYKLNPQTKNLETSEGKKIYVGNDEDYFPSSPEKAKQAATNEKVRGEFGQSKLGKFTLQASSHGVLGGLKDWVQRATLSGAEYVRNKHAEESLRGEISEEHPYISAAAHIPTLGAELATTGGLSAAKAIPAIGALSAGSRVLDEPGEVALEAGIGAVAGKGLDKIVGSANSWLNKAASRRGARRALPGQQEAVAAENAAGREANALANAQQSQKFNALKEQAQNENSARLHQHNLALQAHEAQVSKLEQEGKRFTDEYKTAKKMYEEDLRKLPELQKQAQTSHGEGVVKNASIIETSFPKNSRILGSDLEANVFLDNLSKSGRAGTREANQANRIIKSMFPENEILSAKDLATRYKSIEEAIQRASPEVQAILNEFKTHLGERLPVVLENSIAYQKVIPSLTKTLESDVAKIISGLEVGKGAEHTRKLLLSKANTNLKQIIREIHPTNFMKQLESGELSQKIREGILSPEDFLSDIGYAEFAALKKQGLADVAKRKLAEQHTFFVNEMGRKVENALARAEIKAMNSGKEAAKKFGKDIKKTYGLAEPIAPPVEPVTPEMPVNSLLKPQAPINAPMTGAPIPQTFSPQPTPNLAPAQGSAEKVGEFLEKPLFGGKFNMKNPLNNPLAKLGGLKYVAGKAALPLEAAYAGTKLLTSPTAAGEVARMTFKQGGIRAIMQMAEQYPSYHDGIIENPQERRSFTRQIEDDGEIPLEEKAIIQSKINRGTPLQQKLH